MDTFAKFEVVGQHGNTTVFSYVSNCHSKVVAMCGRFSSTRTDDELRRAFGVHSVEGPELEANWNVAPTHDVRIVLDRSDRDSGEAAWREMRTAHWGLVPFWTQDAQVGNKMINARIETVLDKPAYKVADPLADTAEAGS